MAHMGKPKFDRHLILWGSAMSCRLANWRRPYRVSNIPTIKTKGRIAPPKMAIHV